MYTYGAVASENGIASAASVTGGTGRPRTAAHVSPIAIATMSAPAAGDPVVCVEKLQMLGSGRAISARWPSASAAQRAGQSGKSSSEGSASGNATASEPAMSRPRRRDRTSSAAASTVQSCGFSRSPPRAAPAANGRSRRSASARPPMRARSTPDSWPIVTRRTNGSDPRTTAPYTTVMGPGPPPAARQHHAIPSAAAESDRTDQMSVARSNGTRASGAKTMAVQYG